MGRQIILILLLITISTANVINTNKKGVPDVMHVVSLRKEPLDEIYRYMMQDDSKAAAQVIFSNEVTSLKPFNNIRVYIVRNHGMILLVRPHGSRVQFYIFKWSLR